MNAQLLFEALELVERELYDLGRDVQGGRCVVQQLGDLRLYVKLELRRARKPGRGSDDVPGQLRFVDRKLFP